MPLAVLRSLAGPQTCSKQQWSYTPSTWERMLVRQRAALPGSHPNGNLNSQSHREVTMPS